MTLLERTFLTMSLKKTFKFYKKDLNEKHFSLINRGYFRPLRVLDEDVVALPLTEAGRIIAEMLIFP